MPNQKNFVVLVFFLAVFFSQCLFSMISCSKYVKIQAHNNSLNSLAWSADGRFLATASEDGVIILWELKKDVLVKKEEKKGHASYINKIICLPNTKTPVFATASHDKEIKFWKYNITGQRFFFMGKLTGHKGSVVDIDCHPSGEHVASFSVDGILKIWNLKTQKTQTYTLPENFIFKATENPWNAYRRCYNIRWSPDGRILAVTSRKNIILYKFNEENDLLEAFKEKKELHSEIFSLSFHPQKKYIVLAMGDPSQRIFQTGSISYLDYNLSEDRRIVRHMSSSKKPFWCVTSISWRGDYFVTGSWDTTAMIWDSTKEKSLLETEGENDLFVTRLSKKRQYDPEECWKNRIICINWNPKKNVIAYGCGKGKIHLCFISDLCEDLLDGLKLK